MKVNGKEFGMYWSVHAHIKWESYILKNKDKAYSEAMMAQAMIMHDEWCRVNKIPESKHVKIEEIYDLPEKSYNEIVTLAEAQRKADSEVSIEAIEVDGKNASGAEVDG